MNVLEAQLARRSVRSFTGEAIPAEDLNKIISAGLVGPTGKGKKPWQFFVVEDRATLDALCDARKPAQKIFQTAGAAIAVFGDPSISDTWIEDCSIAMTNMHLLADALGLGSCWIQGRLRIAQDDRPTSDYVRNLLNVPEGLELEAILAIGRIAEGTHPAAHTEAELDWDLVTRC